MLKHEFLELTKKTDDQVSDIDYARVEALYNELDDMSKQEFCRMYTDDVPLLLYTAAMVIRSLKGGIALLKDDKKKLARRLIQDYDYEALKGVYTTREIIKMKIDEGHAPNLTTAEIIKMKIEEGHAPNLTNDEIDYIKRYLK